VSTADRSGPRHRFPFLQATGLHDVDH
jgi:hypothetical protein